MIRPSTNSTATPATSAFAPKSVPPGLSAFSSPTSAAPVIPSAAMPNSPKNRLAVAKATISLT